MEMRVRIAFDAEGEYVANSGSSIYSAAGGSSRSNS